MLAREGKKKIVGMWGTQQANQEELLTQLPVRCTNGEARKEETDLTDRKGGREVKPRREEREEDRRWEIITPYIVKGQSRVFGSYTMSG
jgi:hypothetical protein